MLQTKTFRGGVHPPAQKLSASVALEELTAPSEVTILLKQHIGTPVNPLVKVGERVLMGQKIGDVETGLAAPVHASVAGKVKSIGSVDGADGKKVAAITIENDGSDELHPNIAPYLNWDSARPDELREYIREAGIVGMGGAGFPTHAKLRVPPDKRISALIINGAECEPYLTCDHRLLLEQPELIFTGIRVLMQAASVDRAYIGIKITMDGVQEALKSFFAREQGIDLVLLESKYPQGEERQLIYAVTGKEIPSGGLPWDVGAMVVNVSTAWAVGSLVTTGLPSIKRAVTVTGSVHKPGNFLVRIGTPLKNLVEAAGGFSSPPGSVILGGPMTGFPQHSLNVNLTKQNNGVLVLNESEMGSSAKTDCIHCGKCVSICPCRLMPVYLGKEAELENVEQLKKYNILDCRECGSCAYICPAKIPLLHWIRLGKGLVQAARR